jgi:hypothetical protein
MIAALLFLQVQTTVPCEQDPRCRLEMARARELARYQAQYLRELEHWVQIADETLEDELPHRTAHPLGLDLFVGTSIPRWGVVAGYTPAWPVRVELFYGKGSPNRSSTDPMTSYNTYSYADLQTWGFQQRWYLLSGMFSPVATTGLGFTHGDYNSDTYCGLFNCNGSTHSYFYGVTAHSVYSGLGVDFQWKWIHAMLAWRFEYPFYVSVKNDGGGHDTQGEKDLKAIMSDSTEGIQFEIGARY